MDKINDEQDIFSNNMAESADHAWEDLLQLENEIDSSGVTSGDSSADIASYDYSSPDNENSEPPKKKRKIIASVQSIGWRIVPGQYSNIVNNQAIIL